MRLHKKTNTKERKIYSKYIIGKYPALRMHVENEWETISLDYCGRQQEQKRTLEKLNQFLKLPAVIPTIFICFCFTFSIDISIWLPLSVCHSMSQGKIDSAHHMLKHQCQ